MRLKSGLEAVRAPASWAEAGLQRLGPRQVSKAGL